MPPVLLLLFVYMIAIANFAMLFLLSLPPTVKPEQDPHGLYKFARDPMLREMVTEGRFQEFDSAVEGFVGMRLSIGVAGARGAPVSSQAVRGVMKTNADLAGLLETLKGAVKIASFAAELQTAGPAKAGLMAVGWLESGLVRRSGIKPAAFPALFALLKGGSLADVQDDLAGAHTLMDSSYANMLSRLGEAVL